MQGVPVSRSRIGEWSNSLDHAASKFLVTRHRNVLGYCDADTSEASLQVPLVRLSLFQGSARRSLE